jgi:hypothetical protein
MIVSHPPESPSTSRRALLTGALGGLGALAAAAIGRPAVTRAANGGNAILGTPNTSTIETSFENTDAHEVSLRGIHSSNGTGVGGFSSSGWGVHGDSDSGYGVIGGSGTGSGVYGTSSSSLQPAIVGRSAGANTGVMGCSGTVPAPKPKTGVYGYAAQDSGSVGVWGESPAGLAVYGKTTGTGYAGYFNGKVYMSQFVEMGEVAVPAAPVANRARLFIRDNAGKTQLCVRFHTGVVKVLATEP